MQLLSKTVSWIFLPLFMPIYGLLLTLYIPSQEASISNTSLFDLPDGLKTQILFLFVVSIFCKRYQLKLIYLFYQYLKQWNAELLKRL